MSRFFVGQRVRVVKAFFPENVGRETGITEIFDECESQEPGWPVNCCLAGKSRGNANHTDRLEPILPEGAQPSEFSFAELMDNLGVVVT